MHDSREGLAWAAQHADTTAEMGGLAWAAQNADTTAEMTHDLAL
jgi:hypothetical protein